MDSATKIALAMGIPKEKIRYIRNRDATKKNLLQAIEKVADEQRDGRAFIYYSGHGTRGFVSEVNGCVEGLLSYDGQVITNTELALALKHLNESTDKVLVMLDACHSKGVLESGTRSISSSTGQLTPKFAFKQGAENDMCAQPVNYKTRGLFNEVTRLGGIQENFVQIAAARENEVSFDQPDAGGLATQGIRDCMLGVAKDVDRSGAVSLEEVRQCAQAFIEKVAQSAKVEAHHITVRGNRNLIPVAIQRPQELNSVVAESPDPVVPPVAVHNPTNQPTQPAPTSVSTSPLKPPQQVKPPTVQVAEDKVVASLATLKDIESQRNPKRIVDVKLARSTLKIGKDSLDMQVKSNRDGYIYMILLGSDAKSFYVLYPNGLDQNNQIKAGKAVTFPKPDWKITASGPEGVDQILVIVADTPRKLDGLTMAAPNAAEPFTYALNDIGGRSALINFLIGTGVDGRSESFGAKIVSVKEIK
jgi:hypothetical protein